MTGVGESLAMVARKGFSAKDTLHSNLQDEKKQTDEDLGDGSPSSALSAKI